MTPSSRDSESAPWVPIWPRLRAAPWWGWLIAALLGVLLVAIVGCCLLSGLAAGLIVRMSQSGAPEATATLTKTFTVGVRLTLVIHDTAGAVTLTRGGDGRVAVQATRRVRDRSETDARRILDELTVDVTQDGNTITIQTRFPSETSAVPGGSRTVDIDLTVPQASQVNADVAAGNVTIGQIAGQMIVTVTAGNIEARNVIFAGASRFTATAGNVTLDSEMNSGTLLEAQVTTGNITLRLPAGTPAHLDARTDVGTVHVNGWPIQVVRQGTTGAQAVGDLHPGPIDEIILRASAGNITFAPR
jgi:hypothetical protein